MYSALTQSLFRYSMLDYSKSPLIRFYSTKRNIKSSQNYYDVLKITPYATQNEVKSAYYKLSLEYHPDKNKTEYAKQKFQDISDAYEILSNLELRSNYDRSMLIRRSPTSTTVNEPTSKYKENVYSSTFGKTYNFDAWVKAHYGKQINVARNRRDQYEEYKMMEEQSLQQRKSIYGEISLLLLTLTVIAALFTGEHDRPKSKTEKLHRKER